MKTADLITSYLNNEMTPEQERQFLLSVAASDSMRLSLKSHVMLDRIVTNQVQHTHVPESLRNTIFAQMAASMPQGISGGGAAGSTSSASSDGMRSGFRFFDGKGSWFGRGALVALFTLAGFAAGYLVHPEIGESPAVTTHAVPSQTPQRNDDFVPVPPVTAQPSVAAASGTGTVVAETVPQQEEPSRSAGALRSSTRPQVQNRVQDLETRHASSGQQPSQVLPSSPLDPSNRVVKRTPAFAPNPEAGRNLTDSVSRAGSQPANVDVQATIRTSSDSNKDSQVRNP